MSMVSSMKRKRNNLQEGLAAGERLKRSKLATTADIWTSPWGWVGTDVLDASSISKEHLMATCGFLSSSGHAFCKNKLKAHSEKHERTARMAKPLPVGETPDDVIVVSDDDTPGCSKRSCRKNPNCLNYLGQDKWADEEEAFKAFRVTAKLGKDPTLNDKKSDLPVGLRNLGATCYANAYLQVWFQDIAFRNGVYRCLPAHDKGDTFEDSPIFQLQTVFAALQGIKKKVFNPVKLVESLKLRTSEQQDAQEFSKLFMSHLDTEFQKQSDPELKDLLSRQFEGNQAYTTTCQRCKTCSSNDSNFLELELNLENNASLESRMQALLQAEILSGDNQYRCSHCNSLQDAARKIILRKLPPVLHFSLLRFVFDLNTLERKKSKHLISFPTVLDMGQFVEGSTEKDIYELRGVLLHKGQSAYHGHYEAMVQEASSDTWFQFNDEVVTKIKPPGAVPGSKEDASDSKSQANGKKRKRIVESEDDEIQVVDAPSKAANKEPAKFPSLPGSKIVSSKDAYMLVYSRRQTNKPMPMEPSSRAQEVIASLNAAHDKAVESYSSRLEKVKSEFDGIRAKMLAIFRSWSISSADQPSVVASRYALEQFASRSLVSPPDKTSTESPQDPERTSAEAQPIGADSAVTSEPLLAPVDDSKTPASSPPPPDLIDVKEQNGQSSGPIPGDLDIAEIVCPHGKLNPDKANDMKRIDKAAYELMNTSLDVHLSHTLTPADVCDACVKDAFPEKLYQRQHPQHVAEYDKLRNGTGSPQYWLSRKWLKDWRQAKPKMHVNGQDDPEPSSGEFYGEVFCEHGNLSNNLTTRQRISREAYSFLQSLFPGWNSLADDQRSCTTCMEVIELSRGEKQAMKKRAEDEKARLKHMNDNALNGNTALLEDTPQALVPANFIREWRHWHIRPNGNPRPLDVNNRAFICDHGLLAFDLNKGDIDETMCIIRRSDWDTLRTLYDAGPPIFLSRHTVGGKTSYKTDPEVCQDCRVARKSAYEVTEITIRVLADGDPLPTPEAYQAAAANSLPSSKTTNGSISEHKQTTLPAYASRQSKRLRTAGSVKRREARLTISKLTTVKDLKLQISDELGIPTICQRLFRAGAELSENGVTLGELGVLARDVLELREEREDEDLLDVDADADADKRRRRDEGRGFGGTLLGGDVFLPRSGSRASTITDGNRSASEQMSSPPPSGSPRHIACGTCTYNNPWDAEKCEVCDTAFL